MTKKQKAEKWFRTKTIKQMNEFDKTDWGLNAFIAGYEQAEYDVWFKYSRLAFKELEKFAKRYELHDNNKEKIKWVRKKKNRM